MGHLRCRESCFFAVRRLKAPTTRGGRVMAKVDICSFLVGDKNFSQIFSSPVFSEEEKAKGLRFLQPRIVKAAEQAARKEAISVMSKWRMKIKNSRRQEMFAGLVKDYLPKHALRVAKKMTGLSSEELIRLTELAN